ncbi:sucrose-6-phosphate hydrolase [Paraliobacillus ryukyuensis]|uniref:Sucrose-6-phosphate hydrolase n=1 Tax=Paraliobacillus ryukyuensis TaxID=200904 RepID=A0A366DSV4_9BACI|nr:glycoside hydrolase family 32 protein [Paraliobacillus ryukyuensis]RBO93177.1 beta-fructofuranosidase [Paraliobacillus ryukyuensis]
MYTLQRANKYIEDTRTQVIKDYRHDYHVMAPVGWINDPNGFIYYEGEYHLFYQYYPYKSVWGPMHWGHSKSKDLVNWESAPVALAPDQWYDKDGCFSGTTIEKDGKIYAMYTGHIEGEKPEDIRQVQCIAVSEDGNHFEKVAQNPVLDEDDLPDNAMPQDFRDPKVIQRGEIYYSLIASKFKDGGGQILLYKSSDLLKWEYVSVLLKGEKEEGYMWECPDLFELDGKDVLIISIDGLPTEGNKFSNTHSVLSIIGKMDWEKGIFHREVCEELDYGLDFYAPQTIMDAKQRRVMVSWMQMWGRNIPTDTLEHGWAGAMTLPRELSIKNNSMYQNPVNEISSYFTNHKVKHNIILIDETKEFADISTEVGVLSLEVNTQGSKRFDIEIRGNDGEKTSLTYDNESGSFILDRKQSGIKIIGKEPEALQQRYVHVKPVNHILKLDIYMDRASVEVFINEGEHTMTSTIYPTKTARKVTLRAKGKVEVLQMERHDIEVKS